MGFATGTVKCGRKSINLILDEKGGKSGKWHNSGFKFLFKALGWICSLITNNVISLIMSWGRWCST